MAFALLHKQLNMPRPCQKLALTDADIDNVRDGERNTYNIVEISNDDYTAILNEEKMIMSYDGTTVTIENYPDTFVEWTTEHVTNYLNDLIDVSQRAVEKAHSSETHKTNIQNSITAIEALDKSTLTGFSYGFYKKLKELGHNTILPVQLV